MNISNSPKCFSYIRFSSSEQLKGDSLNRQLQLSKKYASKKNLILDESLSMRDLGISAFKGEHASKGALGHFLKLIEDGLIPRGSFLLVESLDRLSREQVLDAFNQFLSIIRKGITIVTLIDEMEYSEKTLNTNFSQLIISLTIMSRAHEESLSKSKRLAAAWEVKRKNLKNTKLTKKCPAWLRLDRDAQEFVEISERGNIIKEIFELYLDGFGASAICKKLNKAGINTWGRSKNGWHESYIQKILHNRAVLGEFQPHILNNGKRMPVGDPIQGYYPRIISDRDFFKVQNKLNENKKFGGKNGKISNLFSGMAKCGYCQSSMVYINKGKPPKGRSYLVCDRARRGAGCEYHSIKYDEFEKIIVNVL